MKVITRRLGVVSLAAAVTVTFAGCGAAQDEIAVPSVATFEIEGQTFKIELITRELVEHAHDLMDGAEEGRIPVGTIVRDDPSVNAPWSWHIDPETVEFADMTTEVCDGLPEYVEDGTLTSDIFCPWLTTVVAIEPRD